jgi:hypothetical protein
MSKVNGIWISFDLIDSNNYQGLYTWLDNNHATECGTGTAFIPEYKYEAPFCSYLKKDLLNNAKLSEDDRIYVIYRDNDRVVGKFILGKKRKTYPWTGYAEDTSAEDNII